MRKCTWIAAISAGLVALSVGVTPVSALVWQINISPIGGAANMGLNPYTQDHGAGLQAENENHQPVSSATGGEIGAGIFYDDVTNQLTLNYGYGSDFGFTNLAGNISDTHIHGSATSTVNFPAVNSTATVLYGLFGPTQHTPGSSGATGSVSAVVTLTAQHETWLFDNTLYLNVHSSFSTPGEIRGQLIVVPEPTVLSGLAAMGLMMLRRRRKSKPDATFILTDQDLNKDRFSLLAPCSTQTNSIPSVTCR